MGVYGLLTLKVKNYAAIDSSQNLHSDSRRTKIAEPFWLDESISSRKGRVPLQFYSQRASKRKVAFD